MNEIDLLNMYWNLIFNHNVRTVQYLLEASRHFFPFQEWCRQNQKKIAFVETINEDNYSLVTKVKSIETLDHILKGQYHHQFNELVQEESQKYQILFVHGIRQREDEEKLTKAFLKYQDYFEYSLYTIKNDIESEDLSLYGPYIHFSDALLKIDAWPGILVFKGDKSSFIPVTTCQDVDNVFTLICEKEIFNLTLENSEDYFIQLSDMHLGTKKSEEGLAVLDESLDDLTKDLKSNRKIKFLITGDLMNSPNRKNMYEASRFMNHLKKAYHGDVTFVLGNHDVIVHGFNILKRQKAKVVAYLLGENIKVLEDEKVVIIKIDSTSEGNLARGKVGKVKLQEIDEELETIDHLEDYTMIVMLHHHIFPIIKDDFLKTKWSEKMFFGKIMDSSKALLDADELVEWLKKHHIHYVFHGHKHIPYISKHGDMYVMAGGSACGGGVKENKSRYLNYNVLKYDRDQQIFKYCFVIYDDLTKQERHRVKVHLFGGQDEIS